MSGNGDDVPAYLKNLEQLLMGDTQPTPAEVSAAVERAETMMSNAGAAPATAGTPNAAAPARLPTVNLASLFPPPTANATTGPENGKLRFLLCSTHIHQFTGYAKVSHGILQELAKESAWLETTHFGFQKFREAPADFRSLPPSIEVLDAALMERPPQQGFGFTALPDVIRKKKPHVIMLYNDLTVVAQFLEVIRKSGIPRTFKVWVYCDQVYTTQNQALLDILNRDADRVFTFSDYWKKCLKDQGITRPMDVLHHGFNPKQFFSVPRDLARAQIAIPKDVFLFLNVNRNTPRKRYDLLIMAFAELIVKYPTKPLYLLCICDKGEMGGTALFDVFTNELKLRGVPVEQFGNRLIITNKSLSFKDEEINMFYNAADVGISTADGEGWGLCQFEQMGVGVPQVVPDVGGFKEFCNEGNSVLVKPTTRYYIPGPLGGEAAACDPHAICLAMEEYVLDSMKREAHGKAAKEKVLTYTWPKAVGPLLRRLRDVKDDTE